MFKYKVKTGAGPVCAAVILAACAVTAVAGGRELAGTPASGGAVTALSEQDAVDIALTDNPGLAAIRHRARALSEIPAQEGTPPDPRLLFNIMNLPVDSFSLAQEPMTQMQLGLTQTLPFPGKLALREELAGHLAAAAAADVEEARTALAAAVRRGWWEVFYIERALATVERNQSLMRRLVAITQSQYRTGQGLQQDVLLAQLELSKLLDAEISLKAERQTAAERLNTMMGRAAGTAVALPSGVSEALPVLNDEARFQSKAAERGLMAAQAAQVEAARARVELAEKDYYPDFNLGLVYGARRGSGPGGGDRPDFTSLMFSMNLPLRTGRRQDRALDQRRAVVQRQRYALQARRIEVSEEVATAVITYRRAKEQVELLDNGILPQARQTVDSMLAGYKVNKVDFLNLVRVQIALYEYETRYWRALSEARQALASLAAAVGEEEIP